MIYLLFGALIAIYISSITLAIITIVMVIKDIKANVFKKTVILYEILFAILSMSIAIVAYIFIIFLFT